MASLLPLADSAAAPLSAAELIATRNGQTGQVPSITYTADGQVSQTVELVNGIALTIAYSYSGARLVGLSTSDGTTIWIQALTYDANGDLVSVDEWMQA